MEICTSPSYCSTDPATIRTSPPHCYTNPSPSAYAPGTIDEVDEEEDTNSQLDHAPPPNNAPEPKIDASDSHPEPRDDISGPEEDNRPIALRKQPRNRRPPGEWWKIRKPTPLIPDSDDDDSNGEEEEASVVNHFEPNTYADAIKGPHSRQWKEAMGSEMSAHLENGTWTIVELPPGKKAIGSKWVYKIKQNADVTVECFKARIVAKGFSQRPR